MTTETQDPYEFVDKPSFPVVGEKYADSVDWSRNRINVFSKSVRHDEKPKDILILDTSRKPKKQSIISFRKRQKSKRI